MAVLLFAMAASIGVATFIKNEFDTIATKLSDSVKHLKEKRPEGIPQVNITK